jgi:hypothetical protein
MASQNTSQKVPPARNDTRPVILQPCGTWDIMVQIGLIDRGRFPVASWTLSSQHFTLNQKEIQ